MRAHRPLPVSSPRVLLPAPLGSPGVDATTAEHAFNAVWERHEVMSSEGQRPLGEVRATISNEIVRLQAEYYGKGPTKAKTYIVEDLVVVVLEESFTRAEKTLAERGERE